MRTAVLFDGVVWLYTNEGGLPVLSKGGKCPYCGVKHKHGKGFGHRVAHCGSEKSYAIENPFNGQEITKESGYFWVDCASNDWGAMFESLTEGLAVELDNFDETLVDLLAELKIRKE